ncbi:murein biosynthesis integral membrane protein MurJ [Stackebrandtia nassauensis]|uniref:murein biosynthesis integral membrane protein MurJ n=1 Tax=Stackebrandtia nassauensis TaxID=283811 RepID=UPI0003185434|nr:murein biosynthesis integral membrane protein MurJ [Stackebrandtia nassauensis]
MTNTKTSTSGLARHGAVMAAGTLISRITGFLRNVVIGAALGTMVGDAYVTAQYFPQMVYELVMGGVLTSVVVPLIVRARKEDFDQGEAFTQRLLTLAVVLLAASTACVVAAAPLLARLMGSDDNREVVTSLSYLMLPALFFYGLSAMLQAVLNTREHFAAPMWAPILNNLVIIAMGGAFFVLYSSKISGDLELSDVTGPMLLLLGLGVPAGVLVQSLAMWPALRKVGFRWKWRFDFRELHLSKIAKLAGWIFLYVAVNQIAVVTAIKVANLAAAGSDDNPGPIVYNNAYAVMMMAHGIVAVSVITALMPRLSAAASEGRYSDMAAGLSSGTRLATLVMMPVVVVYIALGSQLSIVMFDWGKYGRDAATATGLVMALGGLALIPFSLSQLQTFAFYSLTDGKTVAILNIPVVAVRVLGFGLSLALLPGIYVVAGIMVTLGISYVVSTTLSTIFLRRRIGLLGMRAVVLTWVRQLIAGAAALAAAWGALAFLPGVDEAGKGVMLAELLGVGALILVVYLGVAYVLRIREITELTSMVRGKFGR